MSKKRNYKPVIEITISVYEDGNVDMYYPNTVELSKRIIILTQALEHEKRLYEAIMSMDDNRHLPC